jgi:hypothetical protein
MREILALTRKQKCLPKATLKVEMFSLRRVTAMGRSMYQPNHVTLIKQSFVRLRNAIFEVHPITVVL